jgi:hypothetical protein
MSQNNQRNNRNGRNNRRNRNNQNGRQNQRSNEKEQQQDKKVPMKYQIRKAKEASTVELKYTGIDNTVDKTRFNIFEDGNDEEYLKLIKEFQNHVNTYEIWNDEHAAYIVYKNFRRCLAGATRDLWDQILENAEEDQRDELTFQTQLAELTSTVLGNDALRNQKDYLKNTPKPENMSVKQWLNRLKNINSYLPLMEQDGESFTEADLISEIISKNIPTAWKVHFRLAELHLKRRINDILSKLTVIEESVNVKTHPKNNQDNPNKKQLKNPCRVHNGHHEWDDCRQNPKNQKDDGRNKNANNNRSRRGNDGNGRTREENRRTERSERESSRNRSRNHSSSRARSASGSDSGYESHCMNSRNDEARTKTTPSSEILVAMPNKKGSKKYTTYLGLVDSGSSGSLVDTKLVKNANFNMESNKTPIKWDTAGGILQTNGTALIEKLCLPQFTQKRQITSTFHTFDKRSKDKYDFILGRDLLTDLKLIIDYSVAQFKWDSITVDMVPSGYWTRSKIEQKQWNVNHHANEELQLAQILPADYKPADLPAVVQQQTHLTAEEREQLLTTLFDFQELFQGKRGEFKGEPIELELLPGSKPFYAKPFSIPKAYQKVTKDEIARLEEIGLFTKVASSEWAAPTFIIPKKNHTVRVISDFRGLNKCLKRNPYPMPKIPDIFRGMEKFRYATTIDLNMGYYSMPLSEQSKKLCVITLPWGLYQYNMLPMGVKPATDIFQQRMGVLFHDMPEVSIFMDDTIVFGYADFGTHLADVTEVLRRLQAAGMQVNPDKCLWFQSKVTYLGFVITRDGIKPQPEKIQGILHMQRPKSQKDIRRFVGMVNFYRDLYPKRAETLAPLTDLCGEKKKFQWTDKQEQAFIKMKDIITQDTMLTYPAFDQPFIVYTDASDKQIGGVVTQNGKPLGFFSKKLTDTQRRYPVTEQELLAIVETLKYFRHMLLGHKIVVKTDHKNLTHPTSTHTSDRVLRQRLVLEEFGVDLEYIKGAKNVVADALSRLPTEELFMFDEDVEFPLNLALIADKQQDAQLAAGLEQRPPKYETTQRNGTAVFVHKQTGSIYVPAALRSSILQWYHTTLQHPGTKRMQATLRENFYWPGMDASVESLVRTCDTCQQCKLTAVRKYGKIPLPANTKIASWEEVHVDLIGPWDVHYNSQSVPGKGSIQKIQALTIIDKATGWPEFAAIRNKTSYHIALLFDSTWLCRYPRPARVVYDNGGEFVGNEFQEMLQSYGIKPIATTIRNPKSNGVIERVHLTMGDMLRAMTFSGDDWFLDMQRALDAVAWAVRTTINPNIKHSPCHLAFNQDMIFRRAVTVNWEAIQHERQKVAAASNKKENRARLVKEYLPGDQVLLVLDADERRGQPKMSKPTKGPFTITQVQPNGTVTIRRGSVSETINIRRIKPYHTKE